MRGPKPNTPIELTEEEAAHLRRLIRAHTTGQRLAVRAQVVDHKRRTAQSAL